MPTKPLLIHQLIIHRHFLRFTPQVLPIITPISLSPSITSHYKKDFPPLPSLINICVFCFHPPPPLTWLLAVSAVSRSMKGDRGSIKNFSRSPWLKNSSEIRWTVKFLGWMLN